MGQGTFRIIFSGVIDSRFPLETVKRNLAKLFGREPHQVEWLFSGRPHNLKTVHSLEEAKKFLALLARAGAVARLETETPSAKPAPAPAAPKASPRRASASPLEQNFSPVRLTLWNRITLVPISLGLLLLPTVYVLILVLLAGTGFLWAAEADWLYRFLPESIARALQWGPAMVGWAAALLLAKPLLPGAAALSQTLVLDRSREPEFFALVDHMCDLVKAPHPMEVELSQEVEARADYHRGMRDYFTGKISLRLGLPLLAALTNRQLAGVLARELSPFARSGTMRVGYPVRRVNQWLWRAARGKDVLDARLEELSESGNNLLVRLADLGHRLDEPVRRLMERLLKASLAMSANASRRLELLADAAEAQVGGSDQFRRTLAKRRVLERVAAQVEKGLMERYAREQTLPESISKAILAQAAAFPAEAQRKLLLAMDRQNTGPHDMEPCDRERVLRAEALEAPGERGPLFNDSPSRKLLRHFDGLARQVSFLRYRNQLDLPVTGLQLQPVGESGGRPGSAQAALELAFFRAFHPCVPLAVEGAEKGHAMAPGEALGKLKRQILITAKGQAQARASLSGWRECYAALVDASQAEVLMRGGLSLDPHLFGVEGGTLEDVHQACRQREQQEEASLKELREFASHVRRRLLLSLGLLWHPDSAGRLRPVAAFQEEVNRLSTFLRRTDALLAQLRDLRLHLLLLEVLLSQDRGRRKGPLHDRLVEFSTDTRTLLTGLQIALKSTPHPLSGKAGAAMKQFVGDRISEETSPYLLLELGFTILAQVESLRRESAARLCLVGEQVERAWGIKLLKWS